MGIDLGQPLVIAADQTILFSNMSINRDFSNNLSASLGFKILDENSNVVDSFIIPIASNSFSVFWQALNTPQAAQMIYQKGLDFKQSKVPIPANIADDFVNQVIVQNNVVQDQLAQATAVLDVANQQPQDVLSLLK